MPDLDIYSAFIAGYASSATQLAARPVGELRAALPRLRRSFFDTYPQHLPLRHILSEDAYPRLWHELRTGDELRAQLATLMEDILASSG